jgi:hypothetical protein
MAMWIYDEKFPMDMRFLFGMLSFTIEEDDDLNYPTQEQEKRRTTMISLEFPSSLKNSATMFQAAVRQSSTTNTINTLT